MRIENGNLLDAKGSIIKVGDEVEITKLLADQDSMEYIQEGDIWEVKAIDLKDSDMPLYLTKEIQSVGDSTTKVTEWFGVEDGEITLLSNIKQELANQMERVKQIAGVQSIEIGSGKTEIRSDGLRVQDGNGDITLCISKDGDVEDNDERIKRIVKRQLGVYIAKNDDYGDSVLKGRIAFGAMSELTRMSDKINRFNALVGKEETAKVAESLDDTVMDLVNYMAMYYSDLKAVNSLSQIADNLVNILVSPKSWLERLSREVCMEHCLDVNSKEFNKLVDKMQYLR